MRSQRLLTRYPVFQFRERYLDIHLTDVHIPRDGSSTTKKEKDVVQIWLHNDIENHTITGDLYPSSKTKDLEIHIIRQFSDFNWKVITFYEPIEASQIGYCRHYSFDYIPPSVRKERESKKR